MVSPIRVVVWSEPAQYQMQEAFIFITKDSSLQAQRILEEIVMSVNRAITNPEIYPADEYKKNNDGSYRAFEKHHYRISFRFDATTILVLRVRHTAMSPKKY